MTLRWGDWAAEAEATVATALSKWQRGAGCGFAVVFKIGLCSSPLQRYTHPVIGYEKDNFQMEVIAASTSRYIAELEKHLIRAYTNTPGLLNVAKGGEGAGPFGTHGFCYVVGKLCPL